MLRAILTAALVSLLPAAHATIRIEQVHPALAAANATERSILFTGDDRQLVDNFFRRYGSHGAETKQVVRRDPLLIRDRVPEKIVARPLPQALDHQLPQLPAGYGRVIVGRDVLLVELRSHTILDIMREVVR
jgi:hypothetical protein